MLRSGLTLALVALGALGALGQGACNKGGDSDTASAEQAAWAAGGPEPATAARGIFDTRCQTCHGPRGEGNGPASAGLSPPPRNFTLPDWQSSVTDEHIERIIVVGGAGVGLSAGMPNNPDLREQPQVVTELRRIVRSFGTP